MELITNSDEGLFRIAKRGLFEMSLPFILNSSPVSDLNKIV